MANDVIPSAVSLGARNLYRTGVDGPTIEIGGSANTPV